MEQMMKKHVYQLPANNRFTEEVRDCVKMVRWKGAAKMEEEIGDGVKAVR